MIKRNLFLICWIIIALALFCLSLSHYTGFIIPFCVLGIVALFLFLPIKAYLKINEYKIKKEKCIPVIIGSFGLSFIFWYLASTNELSDFDIYSLVYLFTLDFLLFPLLYILYDVFNNSSYNKKNGGKSKTGIKIFYMMPIFVSFAFFFFILPLNVYFNNITEIPFSLNKMILSELFFYHFLLVYFLCLYAYLARSLWP